MKYDANHAPLVCMQTESACYRGTKPMTVRGVLWHSTGANNPRLSRYIQPADNDPDRDELLNLLGVNKYGNDYNHGEKNRQMGVNAWIGKLADGTVAAVQAMPWGWKPWGCGGGARGSCNDGWIQFEICEDGLTDEEYAWAAYREACELTAYLCAMYHLDPLGSVRFKGVDVPVIIDHAGSHALGLGNNHGDVRHWFPKVIGKTMDDIRADVADLMGDTGAADYAQPLQRGDNGDDVRGLQETLIALGYDLGKWGADGAFGYATEAAVKAFQDDEGLTVTGVADDETCDYLVYRHGQTSKRFDIALRDLSYADMREIVTRWPDAEVTEL